MHRSVLSLVALAATLAACSNSPLDTGALPKGDGSLALLNAMPAGTTTALRLDGVTLMLPGNGQSSSAGLLAGSHQLSAVDAGGATIASATFMIDSGDHRTAVLSGNAAHAVLLVSALDTAAIPMPGSVRVRLVHTAPDAPAMDAYLFEVSQAADSAGRFITPFIYGEGTNPEFPGFAVRPPGTYDVWLKAAGTDNVLFQANNITMTAGSVYSLVLAEDATGALQLRTVQEH